jgi:hypothetical protein
MGSDKLKQISLWGIIIRSLVVYEIKAYALKLSILLILSCPLVAKYDLRISR